MKNIPTPTNPKELLITFIVSGSSITLVSYLATFVNPKLANIIWVFPLGILFSILFMKYKNKSNKDISEFLFYTLLAIFLVQTFIFATLIIMTYNNHTLISTIIISTIVWIIMSIIYYLLFKNINVLKLFDKI